MADYGETVLQGMQVGSSIYSRGADLALRRQQLQSEAATRQLQNEHIAQTMQLQMQEHFDKIDMEAKAAKASAEFQVLSAPVIPMPFGTSGQTVLAPNPMKAPSSGHAFIQAFGKLARNPKEAADIASTGAMMTMRDAQSDYFAQRPGIESDKELGRNTRFGLHEQGLMDRSEIRAEEQHFATMKRFESAQAKLQQAAKIGGSRGAALAHYADAMKMDFRNAELDERAAKAALDAAVKTENKQTIETANLEYIQAKNVRRAVATKNVGQMEAYLQGAGVSNDTSTDNLDSGNELPPQMDEPGAMIMPQSKNEGRIGTDPKTGRRFRITNGIPVPIR